MDEKNVISYLSVKEPMRNMDQLHLTNHRLRTLSMWLSCILTLEAVINEEKKDSFDFRPVINERAY